MKIKTIKKVLDKKHSDWVQSISDESVREKVRGGSIFTGGCIASMLLNEEVNDFDVYFRDRETAIALGRYYLEIFGHELKLDVETPDRVRIVVPSGRRGATAGEVTLTDSGEIEDAFAETKTLAQQVEDAKFKPVFVTTNAITLSNKVQLVLRFYGDPDQIHENYDYVHCTNYWSSWDGELVLKQAALESILSKELRYVGSKYPLASIIRLRKFIARKWTVNAGQILKIVMQLNDLDLTNIEVLQDQLTGVDCAYFCEVIEKLKDKDPQKVNSAYLVEIIDRIF